MKKFILFVSLLISSSCFAQIIEMGFFDNKDAAPKTQPSVAYEFAFQGEDGFLYSNRLPNKSGLSFEQALKRNPEAIAMKKQIDSWNAQSRSRYEYVANILKEATGHEHTFVTSYEFRKEKNGPEFLMVTVTDLDLVTKTAKLVGTYVPQSNRSAEEQEHLKNYAVNRALKYANFVANTKYSTEIEKLNTPPITPSGQGYSSSTDLNGLSKLVWPGPHAKSGNATDETNSAQ